MQCVGTQCRQLSDVNRFLQLTLNIKTFHVVQLKSNLISCSAGVITKKLIIFPQFFKINLIFSCRKKCWHNRVHVSFYQQNDVLLIY